MKFKTADEARAARRKAIDHARKIADDADAAGRKMTDTEREKVRTLAAEAKAIGEQIAELDGDAKLRDSLSILNRPGAGRLSRDYAGSGLNVKGRLSTASIGESVGRKAALEAGSVVVPTPLIGDLRRDGERPQLVTELFPLAEVPGDRFRYLQQTVRTNEAAAVARGALKPTSVFTVQSVDDRVRTVAHVSEPIPRQDLDDSLAFQSFLAAEMRYGVLEALDDLAVTGDGLGENFEGLLSLAGTGAQAFDTDMITTIRKAITGLELIHVSPTHVLLHPSDWETIELSRSDQLFVVGDPGTPGASLPVDRARKRIWGVQVVTSTAVPVGTGVLLNVDDVVLVVREDVRVDVSENVSDDFSKNLVRIRAEMRAALAPLRPAGIVELDLTAV